MALPEPKICFNAGGKRVFGACERIEMTAGMFPNRAELVCPVHEFEKLGKKRNLTLPMAGDVELYLSNRKKPDVILKHWFVVDAENTLRGRRPIDKSNRVIEKRLILMDRRWEFTEGRGGHVFSGTWNKTDKDGKMILGRTVLPLESTVVKQEPATTFTILKHLIENLQFASNKDQDYQNKTRSRLADSIPKQFHDKNDYPVNLELDGANIPASIQSLLEDKGGVWILHNDGTYALDLIGSTPKAYHPTFIPDKYRLPNDAVARQQTSYVVVTSAPNRAAYQEVAYYLGGNPEKNAKQDVYLEAVALDPDTKQWTKLNELSFVKRSGKRVSKLISEFDVCRPPKDDDNGDALREWNCIANFFHHFMLVGPGASRVLPILKTMCPPVNVAGVSVPMPPLFEAKCIYPDRAAGGLVKNDTKWITPYPYDIDEKIGLLSFQYPIIQIESEMCLAPFWHEHYKDAVVPMRLTFAHEDRRTATCADFFTVAYSDQGGAIDEFPADAALSPSASCRILKRPDLIEYRGDPKATGADQDEGPNGGKESLNLEELKKIAKPLAEAALKQVYDPAARRVYAGFWPVECSGMVPHVVYDFQALTTTFDFQTWYVPNRYNEKRDVFKQKRQAEKAETTAAAAPAKASHGYEGFSNTPTRVPGPTMATGVNEILAIVTKATEIEEAKTGPEDPNTELSTCVEWVYSIKEVTEKIENGQQIIEIKENGIELTDCVFNRKEKDNRLVGAGDYYGCKIAYNQLDDEAGDYGPPWIGRINPIPENTPVKVTLASGTLNNDGKFVQCGFISENNVATGVCV